MYHSFEVAFGLHSQVHLPSPINFATVFCNEAGRVYKKQQQRLQPRVQLLIDPRSSVLSHGSCNVNAGVSTGSNKKPAITSHACHKHSHGSHCWVL
jgi:hypothetical protein